MRRAITLTACSALLTLTGCTSTSTPASSEAAPTTAGGMTTPAQISAAPPANSSAGVTNAAQESLFVQAAMHGDPADFRGAEKSAMVAEGHHICFMLESGQTVKDVITYERLGFNAKETGAVIGASPILCPKEQAKVTAGSAGVP